MFEEIMTGNTLDIVQYLIFDWYGMGVYHVGHGQDESFPDQISQLGK
jgi:hypothetical protein